MIVGTVGIVPWNRPLSRNGASTIATAKFGKLVSTKKQTLRRAILSDAIPSW